MKGLSARELIADVDAVAGSRCFIDAALAVLSALLLLSCLLSVLAAAVLGAIKEAKATTARKRWQLPSSRQKAQATAVKPPESSG